ncbi:MAG TPA: hypothetical protein VNB92_05240, partial [Rubrobacter sp.]|nr:hypothetical protein [Rubrobacter sp.]
DFGVFWHARALPVFEGRRVERGALGLLYRPLFLPRFIPEFGVSLVLLAAQSSLVLLWLPRGQPG